MLALRNAHFALRNGHFGPRNAHFALRDGHFGPRNAHFVFRNAHFVFRNAHFVFRNGHFVPRNGHFDPRNARFGLRNARFGLRNGHIYPRRRSLRIPAEAASDIERGTDFYKAIKDGVGLYFRDSIITEISEDSESISASSGLTSATRPESRDLLPHTISRLQSYPEMVTSRPDSGFLMQGNRKNLEWRTVEKNAREKFRNEPS